MESASSIYDAFGETVRGMPAETFRTVTRGIVDRVHTRSVRAFLRKKLNVNDSFVERNFLAFTVIGTLRFSDMFKLKILREGTTEDIVRIFSDMTTRLLDYESQHWSWIVMLNRFGNMATSFGQTLTGYARVQAIMKYPWFDHATGLSWSLFSMEVSMLSIALDPYVDLHSKPGSIEAHWTSMKPTMVDMMRAGAIPNCNVAKIMRVMTRIGLDLRAHHLPVWAVVDHDGSHQNPEHGFSWVCKLFTTNVAAFYEQLFYSMTSDSVAVSLHQAAFGASLAEIPDIDAHIASRSKLTFDWQCVIDVHESMQKDIAEDAESSDMRLPIFTDIFSAEAKWRASIAPVVPDDRTVDLVRKAFGRSNFNFYDVRSIFEGYSARADLRLTEIMPVFFDWLSFEMDPRLLMASLQTCLCIHSRLDTLNSIDMYVGHVWRKLMHADRDRTLHETLFARHRFIETLVRREEPEFFDQDYITAWAKEAKLGLENCYTTCRKIVHGSGGLETWDHLLDDILNALKQVKLM